MSEEDRVIKCVYLYLQNTSVVLSIARLWFHLLLPRKPAKGLPAGARRRLEKPTNLAGREAMKEAEKIVPLLSFVAFLDLG